MRESEALTRRKPKTLPRFGKVPRAIVMRWQRRNIDCATCSFFRLSAYDDNGGLYPVGFCDWRPSVPGWAPWANEALWRAVMKEKNSFSGNPRKGTCAAHQSISPQTDCTK